MTSTMEEQLSADINTLISALISIDHPSSSHLASPILRLRVPKCCPIYPTMLISVNGKEIKGLGCMIPSDRLSKHLDYCSIALAGGQYVSKERMVTVLIEG